MASGLSTTTLTDYDRHFGFKLFGGYQINRFFELEVVDARDTFSGTGAVIVLAPRHNKGEANYKFGGGLQYNFTAAFELRAEAERYRVDDAVSNKGDIDMISLGMVYHFQETPSPTAAQVIAEPVAKPAAEPFPVPEVVPVVVPVAPRLQEYCSILDFQFEVNQTDIQRQEKEKLRVIGTFSRKYPGTSAVIEGYSDNVGKLDANLRLSQRRADAVVRYLVDTFNIAPARLSAVAYGESHPVGDILTAHPSVTATVEGHTANLQATPALALSISELRAQNVVNYLADNFGVARSRLSAEGFGDTRRVAYNTSPQGQQENRRVDVIINYPK